MSHTFTDEERRIFGDYKPPNGNGAGPDAEPDWLEGAPMDPAGTVVGTRKGTEKAPARPRR